ncbi:hypothetical protein [Actinokineospora terrae]|uniref:Uncharacterized protein n=1 Tax=Actinokineospora terrae TaxID=155974 RepID=A0A1H9QRD0_9PSEU|nr:hypothetical protein [Actinokineospora terrae]SER63004.1 hypothetical protein SAMN04487818_104401 [Actinokineospora terrae]
MAGEFDSTRETIAEVAESAAAHAGKIAVIIADAVRDIAKEVGAWVTEVVDAGAAARDSAGGHGDVVDTPVAPEPVVDTEPVVTPEPVVDTGAGVGAEQAGDAGAAGGGAARER